MGWEIERRFLVRVDDAVWFQLGVGHHLRQGYVVAGDPSVRIRTGEERGPVLTCKTGKGIRRTEVDTVVPAELAAILFETAEERVLEKIRWRLGPWELDRFLGALEGLALLEIELESETEIIPEPPPGVHVLREVTEDKRFVSASLAALRPRRQRRLVRKVYREVKGWKGLTE